MNKLVQCLVLACLLVAAHGVVAGQTVAAAGSETVNEEDKKRAALWAALLKALPEMYREIDVYAENASLSEVLFRSGGTTLRFSLKPGNVEVVHHMKLQNKINRITFEQGEKGGYYALWYYGRRELTISVEQ